MATTKQKADWERTAQVLYLLWHGHQTKPKSLDSFNPMADQTEAGLKLNREESTEFLLRNAPVDKGRR